MKRLLPLLAVVFLFTAQSCKQNLCENVVCNNGGTCEDGNCVCTPAFTGPTCDVHTNGCDTIVCLNGGNCLNAVCNCPEHTSGQFCQIQEAPNRMSIWRLTVEHFNPAKPGSNELWDGTDAKADLFVKIKRNGVVIYDGLALNVTKINSNYDGFYPYVLGNDSVLITDITNPDYVMELWDDDGGTSELMYSQSFIPYTDTTGFRGSIDLGDSSEMYQMGVGFRYFW